MLSFLIFTQTSLAQEDIKEFVRRVEIELLNLDPNIEIECHTRLQKKIEDEKIACIKRVNQYYLDRGVKRLTSEISDLDQKINSLLNDQRLKNYPFYEWKVKALKIKKEEKENALEQRKRLSNSWFAMNDPSIILQTPIILNADQLDDFSQRLPMGRLNSFRNLHPQSFEKYQPRISNEELRERAEKLKALEEERKRKKREKEEREFEEAKKFVLENTTKINDLLKVKNKDKKDRGENPIISKKSPSLLVNRPKVLEALLKLPELLRSEFNTNEEFKELLDIQATVAESLLELEMDRSEDYIVNPPLARFHLDELKEKITQESSRSLEDIARQKKAVNDYSKSNLKELEANVYEIIGADGCLNFSQTEISPAENKLSQNDIFYEADYYIFKDQESDDFNESKKKMDEYVDAIMNQHKFEKARYDSSTRTNGDYGLQEFAMLNAGSTSGLDLKDYAKQRPELAQYINDNEMNLSFLTSRAPKYQGETAACSAFELLEDIEFADIDKDGKIVKRGEFSPMDLYRGIQKKYELEEGSGAPFEVFNGEGLSGISLKGRNGVKTELEIKKSDLIMYGDGALMPSTKFFKDMITRGEGVGVLVGTQKHKEIESSMRLMRAQAGEDGHIAHISGYVEMKVDPYDEIEKPMFVIRDSYTNKPVEYDISAYHLINNLQGVTKVIEVGKVGERTKSEE